MTWIVRFDDEFEQEFFELPECVQDELLARLGHLEREGPLLGRSYVDTLNASGFARMKELRSTAAQSAWRVAFAFDPQRTAIILVAGTKSGISQTRFYRWLIEVADRRWIRHIEGLQEANNGKDT
ncbi:type II toxin-antitoxin system RelE/ParE family toxin [Pseudomonas sp. KNUC1026]|uniref:type II toxin-antitoxin system RelE/ParE family toxin n=1 Tax=Pseudomonas sp. KNUC1026 TaxID=2893890 RepID=UPI001F445618|nr:type II toxin-antitoxin system RelE/ParE family toxin [Pseudomonas sp. KNUC1026]UFH50143.1 type II toxin-antitoxin system RelE/ParE family toxin [Pseudomonas sp. KNUC1026]